MVLLKSTSHDNIVKCKFRKPQFDKMRFSDLNSMDDITFQLRSKPFHAMDGNNKSYNTAGQRHPYNTRQTLNFTFYLVDADAFELLIELFVDQHNCDIAQSSILFSTTDASFSY